MTGRSGVLPGCQESQPLGFGQEDRPASERPLWVESGPFRTVLACVGDHKVRRVHKLFPWNMDGIRQRLDQRDAAGAAHQATSRQSDRAAGRTLSEIRLRLDQWEARSIRAGL